MQSVGGSEGGSAHFENVWGIEKNRPREQKKHVLQTLAEVRVGSAHLGMYCPNTKNSGSSSDERIPETDCKQKAILPRRGENSPFHKCKNS